MARKKTFDTAIALRYSHEALDRIDSVLEPDEARTEFMREAIELAVLEREAADKLRKVKAPVARPAKPTPSTPRAHVAKGVLVQAEQKAAHLAVPFGGVAVKPGSRLKAK